jgi:hypothetical protein
MRTDGTQATATHRDRPQPHDQPATDAPAGARHDG